MPEIEFPAQVSQASQAKSVAIAGNHAQVLVTLVWDLAQGPRLGSIRSPDCLAPGLLCDVQLGRIFARVDSEETHEWWNQQTCHGAYEARL